MFEEAVKRYFVVEQWLDFEIVVPEAHKEVFKQRLVLEDVIFPFVVPATEIGFELH